MVFIKQKHEANHISLSILIFIIIVDLICEGSYYYWIVFVYFESYHEFDYFDFNVIYSMGPFML